MKEFLKCKSCGFIIEKEKLGETCPACGVSNKMFKTYELKISEKRKNILNFHLHQIAVHFPQAFCFFVFLIGIISYLIPQGLLLNLAYSTISVLAFFTPILVIPTMISGMIDGKVRFKRLNTPYLKKKIIFGSLFLISSIIAAIFGVFISISPLNLIIVIIASIFGILFGGINGRLGSSLLCAKMKEI